MDCGLDSSSWFKPDSTQPDFTTNYTLDSHPNISWWGNSAPIREQTQYWKLVLAWASDTSYTDAQSSGHLSEVTEGMNATFSFAILS